jgi:phospholipid/cholesterol/gamma-HCH transport system substrate-binding protein
MARERGLEFKVGVLIVVAIAVMLAFIFFLGNFSLSSGYTLHVDYNYIGNMKPGAPVKVAGIKVGNIEKIRFLGGKEVDKKTGRRIQVRIDVWVEDRVSQTLRQDAEFFINTAGVLGEQYLEIVPGDDFENGPLEPGSVVRGIDPPRTDLVVARLYEVLDSFADLLKNEKDLIKNLLSNTSEAVAEVNTLLKENKDEITDLLASSGTLAKQASDTLAKVNQGLGDPRVIGRTIRDADKLLVTANRSLNQVVPGVQALTTDATRVTGLITNERVDRALTVADKAVALSGKADKLVGNVDGLVTDMRAGKGTVGALVARDEIYADLREMIRDLKRNPWKFFWKE